MCHTGAPWLTHSHIYMVSFLGFFFFFSSHGCERFLDVLPSSAQARRSAPAVIVCVAPQMHSNIPFRWEDATSGRGQCWTAWWKQPVPAVREVYESQAINAACLLKSNPQSRVCPLSDSPFPRCGFHPHLSAFIADDVCVCMPGACMGDPTHSPVYYASKTAEAIHTHTASSEEKKKNRKKEKKKRKKSGVTCA